MANCIFSFDIESNLQCWDGSKTVCLFYVFSSVVNNGYPTIDHPRFENSLQILWVTWLDHSLAKFTNSRKWQNLFNTMLRLLRPSSSLQLRFFKRWASSITTHLHGTALSCMLSANYGITKIKSSAFFAFNIIKTITVFSSSFQGCS